MNVYARDYVELPEVAEGDRVRVAYVSGQNDSEQERTGEVREIHANGFRFVHDSADEGYATSVRDHRANEGVTRRVSTLKETPRGTWGHASTLNRGHSSAEETTVEVVEEVEA